MLKPSQRIHHQLHMEFKNQLHEEWIIDKTYWTICEKKRDNRESCIPNNNALHRFRPITNFFLRDKQK